MNKLLALVLLMLIGHAIAFGQYRQLGKYTLTDKSGTYVILNADSTFKFRYRSHAYWDLACGQFEIKGDTISFTYTSDMYDLGCNSERINRTDTSDYFLRTGVDKSYRPVTATFRRKVIQTITTGDTNDPATLGERAYQYKRVRRRPER